MIPPPPLQELPRRSLPALEQSLALGVANAELGVLGSAHIDRHRPVPHARPLEVRLIASHECSGHHLLQEPDGRQRGQPSTGTRSPRPAGRSGSRRIPNVGQRDGCPSLRSKISIGKLDSTPPSTIVKVVPATGSVSVHG